MLLLKAGVPFLKRLWGEYLCVRVSVLVCVYVYIYIHTNTLGCILHKDYVGTFSYQRKCVCILIHRGTQGFIGFCLHSVVCIRAQSGLSSFGFLQEVLLIGVAYARACFWKLSHQYFNTHGCCGITHDKPDWCSLHSAGFQASAIA